MGMYGRFLLTTLILHGATLGSGELSMDMAAKILKIITTNSGGKIQCRDEAMKPHIEANGMTVDAGSRIVWTNLIPEVKIFKMQNRLVVTGKQELLVHGAGIALVEEGGKPRIMLNVAAIKSSAVSIPDALYKLGQ